MYKDNKWELSTQFWPNEINSTKKFWIDVLYRSLDQVDDFYDCGEL